MTPSFGATWEGEDRFLCGAPHPQVLGARVFPSSVSTRGAHPRAQTLPGTKVGHSFRCCFSPLLPRPLITWEGGCGFLCGAPHPPNVHEFDFLSLTRIGSRIGSNLIECAFQSFISSFI